jgi:hypothetical protein
MLSQYKLDMQSKLYNWIKEYKCDMNPPDVDEFYWDIPSGLEYILGIDYHDDTVQKFIHGLADHLLDELMKDEAKRIDNAD